MKKNKMNGFTLIELLAVIVILAIIALIATPIVINIIEDSKKNAFIQTVNGIINAGEYYYANQILDGTKLQEDKVFTFPNEIEELEFNGEVPKTGDMKVTPDGKIALAVNNGIYCITKGFDDSDVTVSEDIENCFLPKTLTEIATTKETLGITEVANCTKKGTKCTFGPGVDEPTAFAIKVNNDDIYKFYVINDDGNEVTLIMDRNLVPKVQWYSSADDSKGPLTAIAKLEEATNEWKYIIEREYTYSDDGGGSRYNIEEPFVMKARMPRLQELKDLGCTNDSGSCPDYLYENLSSSNTTEQPLGYWTTAVYSSINVVHSIFYDGHRGAGICVNDSRYNGLRPVITISK